MYTDYTWCSNDNIIRLVTKLQNCIFKKIILQLTYSNLSSINRDEKKLRSELSRTDIVTIICKEFEDNKVQDSCNDQLIMYDDCDNSSICNEENDFTKEPEDILFYEMKEEQIVEKKPEVKIELINEKIDPEIEENIINENDIKRSPKKLMKKNNFKNVNVRVGNTNRRRIKKRMKRVFSEEHYIYSVIDKSKWEVTKFDEDIGIQMFKMKAEASSYIEAPHKCTLCYKVVSNEEILKRHNQLAHNQVS